MSIIRALWPVTGFAKNPGVGGVGSINSGANGIDLRYKKPVAIVFQLSSPGVADVSFTYLISRDGQNYASTAQTILASSATQFGAASKDLNTFPMPDCAAPYIKLVATGVGANDAGTAFVTCDLLLEDQP